MSRGWGFPVHQKGFHKFLMTINQSAKYQKNRRNRNDAIKNKGPDTRCNFSCNWRRNSTLRRYKIGKYMFLSQFADIFITHQAFVTNLHLLRTELRCKLQEKLHRVIWP